MTERPNIASMTEAAYYNRRAVGDPIPTDAELDALAERVEHLNAHGSHESFVDAQADLIDALLVRLDVLRDTAAGGGEANRA